MINYLEHLDRQLFLLINGWNAPWADQVMWFFSAFYTWFPIYFLLLVVLIKREKMRVWLPLVLIAFLITVSDRTSVLLFKDVFLRYRPCHNLELQGMVHLVRGNCGGMYGFVSSHAVNFFALAVFFSLYFKARWITIAFFAGAILISYSRVYLGVHYPADVFVGALWGALLGWLFVLLLKRFQKYFLGKKL